MKDKFLASKNHKDYLKTKSSDTQKLVKNATDVMIALPLVGATVSVVGGAFK